MTGQLTGTRHRLRLWPHNHGRSVRCIPILPEHFLKLATHSVCSHSSQFLLSYWPALSARGLPSRDGPGRTPVSGSSFQCDHSDGCPIKPIGVTFVITIVEHCSISKPVFGVQQAPVPLEFPLFKGNMDSYNNGGAATRHA